MRLFVELGFAGSSVALYALTVGLVRSFALRFRWLTFASLLVIFVYRLFLVVPLTAMPEQPQVPPAVFFVLFGGGTLLLLWRYYRKIRSSMLRFGLILFVVGQGVSFLNPQLTITDLSLGISAFASLIISFAILQQEIFCARWRNAIRRLKRLAPQPRDHPAGLCSSPCSSTRLLGKPPPYYKPMAWASSSTMTAYFNWRMSTTSRRAT